jgi:hypothetical protein
MMDPSGSVVPCEECSSLLWLLYLRGGGYIVVSVTSDEVARMETVKTRPSDKLEYLGVFVP